MPTDPNVLRPCEPKGDELCRTPGHWHNGRVSPGGVVVLDVDALYVALDRQRRYRRLRWRDVAEHANVSPSTLTRIGQGHRPDADGLVRLLAWLGTTDLAPFVAADLPPSIYSALLRERAEDLAAPESNHAD